MAKPSSNPAAAYQKAVQLFEARQPAAARKLLRDLVDRHPDAVPALQLLGIVCCDLDRPQEGIRHLARAVRLEPASASARSNLGKAQMLAGEAGAALASFRAGLALEPRATPLLCGCANALNALGAGEEAAEQYRRALAADPACVEALDNLGRLLAGQGRWREGAELLARAVALDPSNAEAHLALAECLRKSGTADQADAALDAALALRATSVAAQAGALQGKLDLARWDDFEQTRKAVTEAVQADRPGVPPFLLLQVLDDPEAHLRAARIEMRRHPPVAAPPLARSTPATAPRRLRIGYVSADLREHPVARLVAGLFEAHDRQRCEVIGIAIGRPDDGSEMSRRVAASFDRFVDLSRASDEALVSTVRQLELDIAVDLMGHTEFARPRAFRARLAPLQVNFLGYPGSSGIDEMDYIVLDPFLATPRLLRAIAEKPIVLPHCYQVNDPRRPRPEAGRPRRDYGLPETGLVFCCFNNPQKINPETFAAWMRIVKAAPGSVLWLLEHNAVSNARLREAAARQGVDPARLVLGPRLPPAEHLARYSAADLFLDTFPYGAHTTASDALWIGCPVLTRAGASFPARVGGSLLTAVGLPELIADDLAAFEAKAISLAGDPRMVAELRQRLAQARATSPLFDTALFARHIEQAYGAIWQRHVAGQPPAALDLSRPATATG